MFVLEKKYKKIIDSLVLRYPFSFYVFGSRAKGADKRYSDLDMCIFEKISLDQWGELKENFANLGLPFAVDLVVWDRLSDEFKGQIRADLIRYIPDPLLGAECIELSYIISEQTPSWPGSSFEIESIEKDELFCLQKYSFSAGYGTHIDTPAHMISGGKNLTNLETKKLYVPCVIFYVQGDIEPSFTLTKNMLEHFEENFGIIPAQSWFLLMTGWGKKAFDSKQYRNEDSNKIMHFPTIDKAAAQYLINKGIIGFGLDTLSPDQPDDETFPIHRLFLANNVLILENLKYAPNLLPNSGFLQVIPLNIQGGVESPVRLFFYQQQL